MHGLETTFQAMHAFPGQFRAMIAALPQPLLDWKPASWDGIPSEMLTVRQQACHVRDIDVDGYALRFRRLLGEEKPVLASIETYGLIASRDYDRTEIAAALDAFAAARSRLMSQLEGLDEDALSRTGTFEGYGPVSVRGLIHYLCSHDQQHLAGVQWLAGQYASQA
jgi:hypothetical protein